MKAAASPRAAAVLRPILPELAAETITALRREIPEYDRPLRGPFGDAIRRGSGPGARALRGPRRGPDAFADRRTRHLREPRSRRAACRSVARGAARGLSDRCPDRLAARRRGRGRGRAWTRTTSTRSARRSSPTSTSSAPSPPTDTPASSRGRPENAHDGSAPWCGRWWPRPSPRPRSRRPPRTSVGRPRRASAWSSPRLISRGGSAPGCPPRTSSPSSRTRSSSCSTTRPPRVCANASRASPVATPCSGSGPVVPAGGGRRRGGRARAGRRARREPCPPSDRWSRRSEHLAALLLRRDTALARDLARVELAPFDVTEASAAKLRDTLRSWLDHHGRAEIVARALDVHPQTVRYRVGRLRELFGDDLDDPERRFVLGPCAALRGGRSELGPRELSRASAPNRSRSGYAGPERHLVD